MGKMIFVLAVLVGALSSNSMAYQQPKRLGIGVIIGAPTGFSMKYWSSRSTAVQGFIGGGFGGISIGADYTIHTNALRNPNAPFYYGPGVFFGQAGLGAPQYVRNTVALGVRGVFGIDYVFPNHPFDIAVELGPALLLTPSLNMGIELGIAFDSTHDPVMSVTVHLRAYSYVATRILKRFVTP